MTETVRATDLYLLAVCPHRIHLDRRLPRSQACDPTPGTRLLIERGLALEKEISAELGWPQPLPDQDSLQDLEAAAQATLEMMRTGVPGICQGVLRQGRKLAIPDLLERVEGRSRFGEYHYRPGDIKGGFEPRADHGLQVAFAAHLLEEIQDRYPDQGLLILGDRRREIIALDPLREVLLAAVGEVEQILDLEQPTRPFLCPACGTCPWRERCLTALDEEQDLSLVDGMTPTRRRVLAAEGIENAPALAALEPADWRARGLPPLGLDQLVPQARALLDGQVHAARKVFELPDPAEEALLVHVERDPLREGEVSFLAWRGVEGTPRIDILADDSARAEALGALLAEIQRRQAPVFHFGRAASRTLGLLGEAAGISPRAHALLDGHLWNLSLTLRRGAAYLPVKRYTLEEVAGVLARDPPGPMATDDPLFVFLENLRRNSPGSWLEQIHAYGHRRLDQLTSILQWIRSHPTRRPRRAR